MIGITRQTLYAWIRRGKIKPWRRLGKHADWLFLRNAAMKVRDMRYKRSGVPPANRAASGAFRSGPSAGHSIAADVSRQVFWDYDVDAAELQRLLTGKDPKRRQWAVARILKYARWQDARRILTLKDIAETLPTADLPADRRAALEKSLEVWRRG